MNRLSCFSDIEIKVLADSLADAALYKEFQRQKGPTSGHHLNRVLKALNAEFADEECERLDRQDEFRGKGEDVKFVSRPETPPVTRCVAQDHVDRVVRSDRAKPTWTPPYCEGEPNG